MTFYGALVLRPASIISILGEVDIPSGLELEYGAGLELNLFNLLRTPCRI